MDFVQLVHFFLSNFPQHWGTFWVVITETMPF